MNLDQLFTKTSFKTYQKWLETQKLPAATIKRKLSSLRRFDHWLKKPSVPQGLSLKGLKGRSLTGDLANGQVGAAKLKGASLMGYLSLALLVLFSVALGIYGYQQIFKDVAQQYAYPQAPSPTTPNRYLSFQARLTDSSDNPITVPTDFRFIVYNDETASASAKLWEEQRYIDPDQDGIFSVTLGTETAIATSVFTENSNLWLGVTVETDAEATPRQRIATVGYALNAETLQGFPPSASASADMIPVLTQEGDLVLAAANPMVYSSSGTFAITGQALTITTATGTNGDIQIAPDGTGNLDINLSSTTQNAISITNASQTSGDLIHAYLGNDTATGNLLTLSSGASETNRFTVSRAGQTYISGNLGIGTTNPGAKLEVAGQVKITGGTPGANKVLTSDANGLATWEAVGAATITDDSLDFAQFQDTLDLDANLILNQTGYTWVQNFTGTTATGLTYNANSLTTGKALSLSSTSTALSTGGLLSLDWSPASSTTATGDLLSLNIGTNGTIGNIFNVKDTGSSLFSVSETAVTSNLPTSFTSSGDVSIAYDLLFTNQTASYIKSNAPLYIEAGETFESNDLTLRTYGVGSIILQSNSGNLWADGTNVGI
ncbi:MAG: hypothetical protein U0946_04520, partial [Patescibacteria group bacterium]|nr:hypothetical protein [Patescibacteria group bacterium]